MSRKPTPLTPRNGRNLVVLLAGGPADRARELASRLALSRGIEARYHLDWDRPGAFRRPLPSDVDFVIILNSMLGHALEGLVLSHAEKACVPILRSTHKWTNLDAALRARFGIVKAPPVQAPEPVAPAAQEPASASAPVELPPAPHPVYTPEEEEARLAALQRDTLLLLMEVQARFSALHLTGILITEGEITLQRKS